MNPVAAAVAYAQLDHRLATFEQLLDYAPELRELCPKRCRHRRDDAVDD